MTTTAIAQEPRTHPKRHRARVDTVHQLEATECGAASLAMILGKYGTFEPLEDLRIACGVSRDGSNARNLLKAARNFGLDVRAVRREPEALKDLTFPIIVHWNFYHFLVVEGWYEGGWYLNDPALGPRQCSDEEFDTSFTGIALEMTPGAGFVPTGVRPGVVRRLIAAAGRPRAAVILGSLLALLLLIPTILIPSVIKLFGNSLTGIVGLAASVAAIGLIVALIIQAGLLYLQGALSIRFATKISLRLGSAMVYRLLQLPAAFHAQRGASIMAQRALLADQLSQGVSAVTITAAAGLLTSTIAAVVLLFIDWVAALVAIFMGILTGFVVRLSLKRSKDEASKIVVKSVEAGAYVASSLHQIESVKASGSEDGIIARGLAATYRVLEAQQSYYRRTLVIDTLPGLLSALSTVLVALVTAARVPSGQVSPGGFLATLALAGIVIAPIAQVIVALQSAQTLRATLDQVDDVLKTDLDPGFEDVPEGAVPSRILGRLSLKDVSFGYSPISDPLITDFSLDVEPGHRVALVGPSGCGKSTVSRLVTGLYAPWSGEVLIDGLPRLGHDRQVLAEHLALVDQDVTIFDGTIRENVTLWDPSIPESDVIAALRDAQMAETVARRPGGLDAVLKEGGADLSGGQRQRLEIARALVRNPSILVMDEATSALDPVTEQLIDTAIRRRGITCLVIAHRLSTIRDSDEIVVMDKGRIVERGTHEELIEANGPYSTLVGSE